MISRLWDFKINISGGKLTYICQLFILSSKDIKINYLSILLPKRKEHSNSQKSVKLCENKQVYTE